MIKRVVYGPRLASTSGVDVVKAGSVYGGWMFADQPALHGGVVLSCGLGEDASFDVEIAGRFHATVLLVDPTPRAIVHYEELVKRVGQDANSEYVAGGTQPIDSYDLRGIAVDQLQLIPRALTEQSGTVRFYAPSDPKAVSHSVVNFQHGYSTTTPYIEVSSIDFAELLQLTGFRKFDLAKFDIEGAEITVIPQMLAAGVFPEQVLVEYDELNYPSRRARANFDRVHSQLLAHGYTIIHFDQRSCVSYLRTAR